MKSSKNSKKRSKKISRKKAYPKHEDDLPVTQKMFFALRDELKAENFSLDKKIDSKFDLLNGRIDVLDTKIDMLDKKFESKIDMLDKKFESKIDMLDKKFESKIDMLDKKFESKIDSMEKKFESKLEAMHSSIHKITILVEQQNARNNVVLDGLTSLFRRQDVVENKVQDMEQTLLSIKKSIV